MQPSAQATSPAFSKVGWWNDYIGIPFRWRGYDRMGVSCWGLVCLVYEDLAGVHIPKHDELVEHVQDHGMGAPQPFMEMFQRVPLSEARSGDVLHMRGLYLGRVSDLHCGVLTEPGNVLHAQEGTGTSILRYTSTQNQNRILGAYTCRAT